MSLSHVLLVVIRSLQLEILMLADIHELGIRWQSKLLEPFRQPMVRVLEGSLALNAKLISEFPLVTPVLLNADSLHKCAPIG